MRTRGGSASGAPLAGEVPALGARDRQLELLYRRMTAQSRTLESPHDIPPSSWQRRERDGRRDNRRTDIHALVRAFSCIRLVPDLRNATVAKESLCALSRARSLRSAY